MQRHTKEASQLKELILADLHKEPGCEHVTDFVILMVMMAGKLRRRRAGHLG